VPLRTAAFYAERRISLMSRVEVARIDPAAHRVHLSDGRALEYGALLIATGAEPIRLDLPGATLPHVFLLRTLADSRAVIARAAKGRRAVVVGSSFIGLEVAASLRQREVGVDVVSSDATPLQKVLGKELGGFVRALHEEHGVAFHLGRRPAAISEKEVVLDDGTKLAADFVVLGVGVRPRTKLAEDAGLRVERGIVVDAFLRTSAPDVWAAGDVARYPVDGGSWRIEHWTVAQSQGRTVARNLLQRNEPFRSVPFFWSQHYDVPVNYVGHAESWDSISISGSVAKRDCMVAYRRAGRIVAMASVFRDRDCLLAEEAFERDDQAALERLLRS
jgi:NADPH-dependent 2,4-dienoyl-CoA reductase/sulfur reductase-like enzyme